jgi:hypothetical protein
MKTINDRSATALMLVVTALLTCRAMMPTPAQAQITDFSPEGIQTYLNENPQIASAEDFLLNLPTEFAYHWIMMTHSESSQTGDATNPRFILPDAKATVVFGFELDSQTIEYLHFETATNRFRFHEIDMNRRQVSADDARCLDCHASTREGVRGSRPRPNWDAYDSWAGALPFNRDRIYENSEEEKAFSRIITDLTNHPIVEHLAYPPGFVQDPPGTGPWTIKWDDCNQIPVPQWCKTDNGTGAVDIGYGFDPNGNVIYPGPEAPISVDQGGRYLRVTHSEKFAQDPNTDEGPAVALFDFFTDYNASRVAQELVDFPTAPVDIRPVALAIVSRDATTGDACFPDATRNTLRKYASKKALRRLRAYQRRLDPNIRSFADLLADTRTRMERLPKLKADLQAKNMEGLIEANGGAATPETITDDVARRSRERFNLDALTGFMVDRELYDDNNEAMRIALFRYFLEPVGVAVETWSMSVQSDLEPAERNATYTFGDLFTSKYVPSLQDKLKTSLGMAAVTCNDLAAASVRAYKKFR